MKKIYTQVGKRYKKVKTVLGKYLLHSYICSNLSTEDREKNLYPDLVPTAKDLHTQKKTDTTAALIKPCISDISHPYTH